MSDKKNFDKQIPNNVIPLGPTKCIAEDCKSKPAKAGFCDHHFTWFKAGLITKDGAKAADFDKKHYHWELANQKKRAA